MEKSEVMEKLGLSEAEFDQSIQAQAEEARKKRNGQDLGDLTKTRPERDDILSSVEELPVRVWEDWKINEGTPVRVLICNATIVADEEYWDWYLHSETFGLKCIIGSRSHDKVWSDDDGNWWVTRLKVLRLTRSRGGVVCEALG